MRYHALATDYDGTIAAKGAVDEQTVAALERVRASGRRLILVTGRELDDLLQVFSPIHLFERVVAENGALLYNPATRETRLLAEPPPQRFIELLQQRHVVPLSVGKAIVATWHPHEVTVLEAIRELGLELQVIFNKDAVMVLPSGVNKATGLHAALAELGLSPHNVVGVGDAENDHAFLSMCECSVAVANALPMLKERADITTTNDHGAGVVELSEMLLENDLKALEPRLHRHNILLGTADDGREISVSPYGTSILIAGTSGGGKSTLATGILERLAEHNYQFCIIDPEGDYSTLEPAIILGDQRTTPNPMEIRELLAQPGQNIVINMIGIALGHRPAFFESLLPHIVEMRARTGRPHWILVDETHHLFPTSWNTATTSLPQESGGMLFITVHPEQVSPAILASIDIVIVIGQTPELTLKNFGAILGQAPPPVPQVSLKPGEGILWARHDGAAPFWFRSMSARTERLRHHRKYAEGELDRDRSFYFRGPQGKLNLRAQNLQIFLLLADGVDDETWLFHLRKGDYSRWLRAALKDEDLAVEVGQIEGNGTITAGESREAIRGRIEERYTIPA